VAAALLCLGTAGVAVAQEVTSVAFAPVAGATTIPIGHAQFCRSHADECGPNRGTVEAMALTPARWQQLVDTNSRLNAEIVAITDQDLYNVNEFWTYPNGYGDCEDIALAKRRALISQGWEPGVLLLTVVRERSGAGHAVLLARTDRGDLVLDNQDSAIRLWNETPYQFVKRQSQQNAGQWVLIDDARPVTTVASTR
jgi:predicted transglutaminase-like cysteine proteinase